MKKTGILLALAVFLLSLSGCSCSHDWSEASCETARTCTKCSETEGEPLGHDWLAPDCETAEVCSRCSQSRGEALGHDWLAASCTEPETCSRCGQTQGTLLDHSYGEWVLGEAEMSRSCNACGAEETAELTPERYAQQLMAGHWDFLALWAEGDYTDPYRRQDAYVTYHAKADADGAFCLKLGDGREYLLRWEYASVDPEKNVYTYTMTREDNQAQASAYLVRLEGKDQLVLPFAKDVQIYLFRDYRLLEGMMGTWRAKEDNIDYVLDLAEDHTFTGDVQGEVNGTWYLRPLKELNTNYSCIGLTLLGTRGEEPFEHMILIPVYGDPSTEDIAQQLRKMGNFSFAPLKDDVKVSFRRLDN